MIILESQDYERLGKEAASQYMAGVPLNDAIFKLASDMGLNPEQIKQVCWSANTATHLELFEKKAEDKCIEFPVASPEYILRRMYAPPQNQPLPVAEKIAVDFFSSPVQETEKIAEEFVPEEKEVSDKTTADRRAKNIVLVRKLASELEQQTLAAKENYQFKMSELAKELRKLAYKKDYHTKKTGGIFEYEKDAMFMLGDDISPVLEDLRIATKQSKIEQTEFIKTAEAVKYRLVDTSDKVFLKIAALKVDFDETVKCAKALNWLKKEAGENI